MLRKSEGSYAITDKTRYKIFYTCKYMAGTDSRRGCFFLSSNFCPEDFENYSGLGDFSLNIPTQKV